MKIRFKLVILSSLALAFAGSVGCSEAVDEITNNIDCHSVCQRYADCFNSEYDVEGCTDRCENDADASESREQRLERCDDCIDGRSCAGTFACTAECSGIVP